MENIEKEHSEAFSLFYEYVFGDYRYFHYNGLAEYVCTDLEGDERKEARELIILAFKKNVEQYRTIRAAGHLRIRELVPRLEELLRSEKGQNNNEFRSLVNWALLKIDFENVDRDYLIAILLGEIGSNDLLKEDVITLLIGFGKDTEVINALLNTYLNAEYVSQELIISYALSTIFEYNTELHNALRIIGFNSTEKRKERHQKVVKLINKEISP